MNSSLLTFRLQKNSKDPGNEWAKKNRHMCSNRSWKTIMESQPENFGVITGKENDIVVVDLDFYKDGDPPLWVKAFGDDYIEKFDTFTVMTGRGGIHLYFKYDPQIKTTASADFSIDIKNDGGYVVAPYSTIKKDGKIMEYEIIKKTDIKECPSNLKEWLLNMKNMKNVSPPVSPPSSTDDGSWGKIDEVFILPKCNKEDFEKYLESIKPRFDDFDTWIIVGFICFNNFDGNDIGFSIFNKWSKHSDKYEGINSIKKKWDEFTKQADSVDHKLSYKQLLKWNMEDFPPKNKYKKWYTDGTLIENMNLECNYYTETGDILYYSNKKYIQNKPSIAKQFYGKYSFKLTTDKKTEKINPFDIWFTSEDRKDVDTIVFNPLNNHRINEFNIWKGFDIKNTNEYDLDNISDWLNHIKHIWADDDEDTYNYILNWLARLLQTPHKKNNICLVLHSIEGVGKSIVLDMIGNIIGNKYYYSTSNLKHIIGDFNGDAEGKILVNLNETNWGGDKKMVGSFKEFITDSTIVINKKNKNAYTINNFANTIITTNCDWIVSINRNDRRFNLRECKNVKYDKEYYDKIAKTPLQDIANYFYNRDISSFDSRVFVKSELHEEQVIKNFNGVEMFIDNLFNKEIDCGYDLEDDVPKSEIYALYKSNRSANEREYNIVHFWREFNKICPSVILKRGKGGPKMVIPDLSKAIEDWKKYKGSG